MKPNFFPRKNSRTQARLEMYIADQPTGRGHYLPTYEVTDLNTEKRYLCRVASCGLPNCLCDAVIVGECFSLGKKEMK